MRHFFLSLTLLASVQLFAQIQQGDVSVCDGENVTLSIAEPEAVTTAYSNSRSLDFNNGDYVRIPIDPDLTDFQEVTIEFWYYQVSRGEEFIVATEYFNTGWGFHNENPNVLQWRVEGGPYSLGGSNFPIPYNTWMHVAGVYDGSELRLYANGTLVASEAFSGPISDSRNEDIVINRHVWASGSSARLTGQLDELRISNVARYDADFTPPALAFEPDLNTLGLWHFDEASGSMVNDASGHGHNGTTAGSSWSTNLPFTSGSTASTPTTLWTTGETTSSITLSPNSDQTIGVTVSGSTHDFTDEVEVTLTNCDGCMDAAACNYDTDAIEEDGSCEYCSCLQPPTVVAGFGTNYLLASDGALTGWGANNMDQTTLPTDLPRIIKADGAEEYVILLDEDSNVIIQGGNGPYSNSVPAGLQGMDVAAGRHHMVVVKTDGSLLSLGANYTGLQNEPAVNSAIKAAAGWYHNAAILDDGSVIGWGDNWSAPATPITNAVAIDAGVDHTLVLKDDFTVEEWGDNINSASAWSSLTNVVDIAAGGHQSLAIMSDGSMKAWNASNGNIMFESAPGAFVLDADIDWGSMILLYADGSLETTLTPPAEALAFSDNWNGCDLCASDADGDGICNENDNACFANANLPVFSSISVVEPASGTTASDATVELEVTGGNPFSLQLDGLNGSDDLSLPIPTGLSLVPPGFYLARVLDANGCAAVSSAPGGSTAGQNMAELPIIVNYKLCCGGCGIYDSDADGICDDEDNCTDRTASNYADPANVPCGCNEPVEYQGYAYDVVQIGTQCWFSENLRIETYRNGDPIPFYGADSDWSNAHQTSEGAWCHPNGDASKSLSYGHMYNHWLIMDGRDVCPQGWHVPTDGDFIELEMFMGMPLQTALGTGWRGSDQGVRLKASPSSSIPWDGTDEVGFQWVQGGWRHVSGVYGYIDDLGLLMFTPSAESEGAAYGIRQAGNQFQPGGLVRSFGGNAGDGRSLRCIRD